ncbi:hypothetical protein OY671_006868 [Metschnikowia pulcherrima]|nr:hypothetical protein OY671_006868 [Metschnikowia pulcherrima]
MRLSLLLYAPALCSSILQPGTLTYKSIGTKKATTSSNTVNAQPTSPDASILTDSECFSNPDVEMIDNSLKSFAQHLKAFVASGEFAAEEFEWSAQKLEKKLLDIVDQVVRYHSCHDLVEQLQFSQHVYRSMMLAVPSLIHYDTSGSKGLQLTSFAIGLNVAIFGLFDSYGDPDYRARDYRSRVYTFMDVLEFRRLEFQSLSDVPFSIRYVFQEQILQADKSLKFLELYISERREKQ